MTSTLKHWRKIYYSSVLNIQEAMPLSQLLSNIRYFELKKPKTGMPKRQMLSICQKEGYSVAELTDIQNELR